MGANVRRHYPGSRVRRADDNCLFVAQYVARYLHAERPAGAGNLDLNRLLPLHDESLNTGANAKMSRFVVGTGLAVLIACAAGIHRPPANAQTI